MQAAEIAGLRLNCRSCGETLINGQPFCPSCGKVQPPQAEVSYFDIFALPAKLNIDLATLEKLFYRLSRKLHPDAHARAAEEEQGWSLAQSSLLNDAYRTLKNPVERTKYLLKLQGVQLDDEREQGSANVSKVPADLLEEVFELNMQLEELRMMRKTGEDDPELRADLAASKTRFVAQLKSVDDDLRGLWSAWDEAWEQGGEAKKTAAKEAMTALLQRRSYLQNLVRDVNETLGEL